MFEHFFQCPHCWQEISILLDPSISDQVYVEDCEVCCNPLMLHPRFEAHKLTAFEVRSIEQ